MFEAETDTNNCPGCNQTISEERIRKHIETCERYQATIYRQVSRLDPKAPPNVIKVSLSTRSSSRKNLNLHSKRWLLSRIAQLRKRRSEFPMVPVLVVSENPRSRQIWPATLPRLYSAAIARRSSTKTSIETSYIMFMIAGTFSACPASISTSHQSS